jgi:hypothetical protein
MALQLRQMPVAHAKAAYAAARVWGFVANVEATLGLCREVDSADAATYDRLYDAFVNAVEPTMARVYGVLQEESIWSEYPADTAIKRLNPSMPRLVVKQRSENNPSYFIEEACRGSTDESGMRQLLRARLPDDMKLIDEWR